MQIFLYSFNFHRGKHNNLNEFNVFNTGKYKKDESNHAIIPSEFCKLQHQGQGSGHRDSEPVYLDLPAPEFLS